MDDSHASSFSIYNYDGTFLLSDINFFDKHWNFPGNHQSKEKQRKR